MIILHLSSRILLFVSGCCCILLLSCCTMSLPLKVTIVGSGSVGSTLATALAQSGQTQHPVVIAARDPQKTKAKLSKHAATKNLPVESIATAVAASDVILLATPSAHSDDSIRALAASLGDCRGKMVIDATNPLTEFADGLQIRWKQGTSGGEVLQDCLKDAAVYKCFNTLGVEHMASAAGKDMFYCGPNPQDIASVIAAVGFTPRYVGPIRYARNLEAMAELWIHCAIPPMPAHNWGREWTFGVVGKTEG